MAEAEPVGRIRNLAIYPVKSCGGIELTQALLTPSGLQSMEGVRDREYMIVTTTGIHLKDPFEFISQRDKTDKSTPTQDLAKLVRIKPKISPTGSLVLTWEGSDEDAIDVTASSARGYGSKGRQLDVAAKIWDDKVEAVDQGYEVSVWLSDHLGINAILLRATGGFRTMARQNYMANQNPITFPDAYPIHWFPIESVSELSDYAGYQIPWQTFRPNIIAEGFPTQYEHRIYEGSVSGIPFVDPKPCDRCPTTNINQLTGEFLPIKPTSILAKYKKWLNNRGIQTVIFGENMLPQGEGVVNVEDPILVTSFRNPALKYGPDVRRIA